MTTYAQIYERFAQKITDFKLLELADEDVTNMLHEWMVAALPKCRFIENDLDARNDEQQTFDVNLTNTEIEIICTQMVSEWLAPQINSQLYVSQFFGGKEERFFAQANQLDKLMVLKDTNELAAQKLARDYRYQQFIKDYRSSL